MNYKAAAIFGVIAILIALVFLSFQRIGPDRATPGRKAEIKISDYVEGMETPPPTKRK